MTGAVRDPFGLEPLYLHPASQRTSARLGELLPYSTGTPDTQTLLEYVVWGTVWDESATFFDDIRRVPPGHAARGGQIHRGWRPPEPSIIDRPAHVIIDEFWRVLGDAAERAAGKARKVVVTLSGGLDSTALAAALVERLGRARVHAVTSGDDCDEETRCARATALALGVEHTVIPYDGTLVDWPVSRFWPSDPRSASDISWERATARGDVVMWGLGGDSLQRGDRRHYALRLARGEPLRAAGDILRTVLLHGRKPALGLRRALAGPPRPAPVPPWVAPGAARDAARIAQRRAAQIAATSRRGVDEMLSPIWACHFDWMSADHNDPPLRHVFPFFDVELVEFFATVPTAPWCVDKELLRATLRDKIPEHVRLRPKSLVLDMPKVELTETWSDRLRDEMSHINDLFDLSHFTALLRPGLQDYNAMMPLLRCAAAGRWRASLLDRDLSIEHSRASDTAGLS